ncbi:MAG: hypothetical protein QW186_08785 [Candidatus Bathyarchaeia archaeon]
MAAWIILAPLLLIGVILGLPFLMKHFGIPVGGSFTAYQAGSLQVSGGVGTQFAFGTFAARDSYITHHHEKMVNGWLTLRERGKLE